MSCDCSCLEFRREAAIRCPRHQLVEDVEVAPSLMQHFAHHNTTPAMTTKQIAAAHGTITTTRVGHQCGNNTGDTKHDPTNTYRRTRKLDRCWQQRQQSRGTSTAFTLSSTYSSSSSSGSTSSSRGLSSGRGSGTQTPRCQPTAHATTEGVGKIASCVPTPESTKSSRLLRVSGNKSPRDHRGCRKISLCSPWKV